MKLIISVIFMAINLLLVNVLFAQKNPPAGELDIYIVDGSPGVFYDFKMELISQVCYDADDEYPNQHYISDEYDLASESVSDIAQFYLTGLWAPPLDNDFGLGFYKVSISWDQQLLKYFYIDYRTSDLIENFNGGSGQLGDIFLDYYRSTNELFYWNTQTEFPYYTTIWDEKSWITLKSEYFPSYWENCLALINDSNNHPKLVWGPHPTAGVDEYRVYRKYGSSSWDNIADVDNDVFEYTDETVTITPPGGPAGTDVYYFVKGVVWDPVESETTSTDTVEVNVKGKEIEKRWLEQTRIRGKSFNLHQNYPNPFNPITTIGYSIKEDGFVTLKVFDILGREVATLVDEKITSGTYSVNFNASDLAGGIYFYTLSSGSFQQTRKLILLK